MQPGLSWLPASLSGPARLLATRWRPLLWCDHHHGDADMVRCPRPEAHSPQRRVAFPIGRFAADQHSALARCARRTVEYLPPGVTPLRPGMEFNRSLPMSRTERLGYDPDSNAQVKKSIPFPRDPLLWRRHDADEHLPSSRAPLQGKRKAL